MRLNQKGNTNTILIGILVILLVGTGVYFGIVKKFKPVAQLPAKKIMNIKQQSPDNKHFGTIEGSLGYPSEGIPDNLEVCAEHITKEEKYCTTNRIRDNKYKYGIGYKINVPVGIYYVFAIRKGNDERAYYSKFVKCGLKASCHSHTPIQVVVKSKKIIKNIDPMDWYNSRPILVYKLGYHIEKYKSSENKVEDKVIVFHKIPILKVIVFNDQNENGIMDNNEKYMGAISLTVQDPTNNFKWWTGGRLTYKGIADFYSFPIHQDIIISFPANNHKYYGHSGFTSSPTGYYNLYKVTNTNKYKFRIDKIPQKTKIVYFGLKKIGKWRWEKEKNGKYMNLKEYIEK